MSESFWSLHDARAARRGNTRRERIINNSIYDLNRLSESSPSYQKVTIDDTPAGIFITSTAEEHKRNISVVGDCNIKVGSYVVWKNTHWIVRSLEEVYEVARNGTIIRCNHLFKFQFSDGTIVEKWGVLDSGVYSTTLDENDYITVPDKQYKIFLHLDEYTSKLYIGQRFATGISYNKHGEKCMTVFRITGFDAVSENYGDGTLVMLNARSDQYDASRDNIDLMICDYIEQPVSEIVFNGDPIIRIGGAPKSFTGDGELSWSIDSDSFLVEQTSSGCKVSANKNAKIGDTATLTALTQDDEVYGTVVLTIRGMV